MVNTIHGYQPTHLKAVVERRRRTRTSDSVLWEPSLKCTSTGSGVWHPPFVVNLAITVPKLKTKASGTLLRHKDAYISIENYDVRGKKKLLAKSRLNLSDYFESAAETDVSFRLKLHPESSKIISASIDLTLRKSVQDPTKLNANAAPCLDEDDVGSLGDERLLAPSHQSVSSPPQGSVGDLTKSQEHSLEKEEEEDIQVIPAVKPVVEVPIKQPDLSKSSNFIVPNIVTPPPLPPRQRLVSQDSPPPCLKDLAQESNIVTSTPLSLIHI